MQLGDLERLVARQGRQDGGQPSGEHRLAGARRADHQDVVPPGSGHLQGATGLRLPSDLGEVHRVSRRLHRAGRVGRAGPPRSTEEPNDLGERRRPHDLQTLDQRRLLGVGGGDDHAAHPRAPRRDRRREHTWGGDQSATERELAREHPPLQLGGRHLGHRDEHPHRHGQVEPRTFLSERPGREVDDHSAQWPLQPRALHRRSDPVASVLNTGSGQAGQRERR